MSQSPNKRPSFNSPRTSPFRRPESSPMTSPSKPLSPSSLSPEKHNPFVRRPSQLNAGSSRPTSPFARSTSPFARPSSRLSVVESPSRSGSFSQDTPVSPSQDQKPEPSTPSSSTPPTLKSPIQDTPTVFDGPASPQYLHSPSPSPSRLTAAARPTAHRTVTSSTTATVRPFNLNTVSRSPQPSPKTQRLPPAFSAGGNYNQIPQALLRSMRESFEVLDNANSGTVTSANLAQMLDQLGMDSSPRALSAFFPPNAPSNLNLARYLDILSAAHSELSPPEELSAAFGAFDVDDSGQIDLAELRDALLHTVPERGAEHLRMSEAEIDAIVKDFSARRAFGAKGVLSNTAGKGRGDVFRYRDFMASISGGAGDASTGVA